jgi:hypothetical protein
LLSGTTSRYEHDNKALARDCVPGTEDEVAWWGVVTCPGYESPEARRQRMVLVKARAEAAGIVVSAEPGRDSVPLSITVRWAAPGNMHAAAKRVFEVAGIYAGDFGRGPHRGS